MAEMTPALELLAAITQSPLIVIPINTRLLVQKLDVAVQTIAAQIDQSPPALEHPSLHAVIHLPRPVLRMRAQDQHAIGIQIELAKMKLRLTVIVVVDPLALQ